MESTNVDALVLTLPWVDLLGYERLSDPQKHELIRAAHNALEMRVGAELMRFLPEKAVREFDNLLRSPTGSDLATAAMLGRIAPGYQEIVRQITTQLEVELRRIVADFDLGAHTILPSSNDLARRGNWDGQHSDEFERLIEHQRVER